jgi:hypothetical protein
MPLPWQVGKRPVRENNKFTGKWEPDPDYVPPDPDIAEAEEQAMSAPETPAAPGPAQRPRQRKDKGAKSTRRSMPKPDEKKLGKGEKEAPKGRRRTKAETVAELAAQLKGGHDLASMFTGLDSLRITEPQALALTEPVLETCEKYGISLDAMACPELKLLFALTAVYFPMYLNLQQEIAAKSAKPADAYEVHPNPPPNANGHAPEGMQPPFERPMQFGEPVADAAPAQ